MKKRFISIALILTLLMSIVSCSAAPKDEAMNGDVLFNSSMMEGGLEFEISASQTYDQIEIPPEQYGKFIENNFISTADENVSTFSADVDTASYSYFRRLVNQGVPLSTLIKSDGSCIRTEEMLNYFNYGYAEPAEGELFSTTVQIAPCPWNEEASLLMLGLQAKKIEYSQKNNLVFLVDVSGSMNSQDKLGLLKESFSYLVSQLNGDDTVSIVTYAGAERVVLDGCSGADSESIMKAINSLSAGGSTNGEAGMKKAYEIAEKHYISDGNNRIIIASDGDLNVGISSVEGIEQFVSEKRELGVFLSVLGFGTGNYKDAMMERIADSGNGVYYYIDSKVEAEKVFGTDIFSTLYTIAKDVKLQMTFSPDHIDAYRLVGYENRLLSKEDFTNDRKDAGDLGAGHSVTVCYELKLKESATSSDTPWMSLATRYKEPSADTSREQTYSFGAGNYTTAPDTNFKFACAIIEMSMILHESEYIKDIEISDIQKSLAELDLSSDSYKAEFKALVAKLAG